MSPTNVRSGATLQSIFPSLKATLINKSGVSYDWPLIGGGLLNRFVMIESTNMFLPSLELTVLDRENQLIGAFTITSSDKLVIDISYASDDTETYEFELYSIRESELRSLIDIGSTEVTMTFWPSGWRDLFQGSKVRGFSKMSASSVASDIVAAEEKEIELSSEKRNYIQAQWTDAQFLRHLATYAMSRESAGYWYFFDRYNKFFFCTPIYLMRKPLQQETHKFEFVNVPEELEKEDREYKPIFAWRMLSNYQTMLLQSGYGTKVKWFDYDVKSYKEKTILYTDTNFPSLGKWVFITKDEITIDRIRSSMIGNTSTDTYYDEPYRVATLKMSNTIYSLFTLEVIVLTSKYIRLGDKVLVHIPEGGSKGSTALIECISGEWLVSKISIMMDVKQRTLFSKLVLIRSSINKTGDLGIEKELVSAPGGQI